MGHEIWGSHFFETKRENGRPAWHRITEPYAEPHTAAQALEAMGTYRVTLEPLKYVFDGQEWDSGNVAIVRHPLPNPANDKEALPFVFGTAGSDYELIDPQRSTIITDNATNAAPVETMAALKSGRVLFTTYRLPDFDVNGKSAEQVQNYLVLLSPMTGKDAYHAYTTSVRVVCWNTLQMSLGHTVHSFKVSHTSGAADLLQAWMKQIWEQQTLAVKSMRDAFELMTKINMKKAQMVKIADSVYPDPVKPVVNKLMKRSFEDRMAIYERDMLRTSIIRETAVNLWDGEGIGLDSPAIKHTGYAAYNAIAQLETYRRGTAASTAYNLFQGDRYANLTHAAELVLAIK